MVKTFRITRNGGPEVLELADVAVGAPGGGEIQVAQRAIGLNFIDIYHRTGLYPLPLPSGIGLEAAGDVTAVGEGVTGFAVGDRVAYAERPPGAYCELRNIPAKIALKLPHGIDCETAAAVMLKGLTVQFLFRRTVRLQAGQTILFHAAAGGVGLIAMQWARALGVRVIGTAGSREKAELARAHGCDEVILYREEDVLERVRELTGGALVPVVYDSVGKDTFETSLACLAPFGTLVSFGNASGPVPPVPLTALRGSLYLTRPSLLAHTEQREVLEEMAADLFAALASGAVRPMIGARYPLAEAARAHADLEARRTTGSTLLVPH